MTEMIFVVSVIVSLIIPRPSAVLVILYRYLVSTS